MVVRDACKKSVGAKAVILKISFKRNLVGQERTNVKVVEPVEENWPRRGEESTNQSFVKDSQKGVIKEVGLKDIKEVFGVDEKKEED